MELCTEGSLQKMLSEPQHVFGLREALFVSFFIQFGPYTTFTLPHLHYTYTHAIHAVYYTESFAGISAACAYDDNRIVLV